MSSSKSPQFLKACLYGFVLLMLNISAFAQHYNQINLVSDTGSAPTSDPNLKNAWGLVAAPAVGGGTGSPWWVANNAAGTATLYSVTVTGNSMVAQIQPINGTGTVAVGSVAGRAPGSPTGVMFNGSPTDFILPSGSAARFIFVTEDGTVQGWADGPSATVEADNSQVPSAASGAVYKGATIAEIGGKKFVLAANFRSGKVDIFDRTFQQVRISLGNDGNGRQAFDDPSIPRGFAPFNIQGIGPNIYVTYARQDAAKHDPVGGAGLGFVEVFNSHGQPLQRLQTGAWMNAPWGIVRASAGFGEFSNAILVGQFRGGNIAAFNPVTGKFMGNVLNPDGTTLIIDGLWSLRVGNDGTAGPATTLFFTAGPNGEKDGLLGSLVPATSEGIEADEQ